MMRSCNSSFAMKSTLIYVSRMKKKNSLSKDNAVLCDLLMLGCFVSMMSRSHYGLFLGLLALDIASHWIQMYRYVHIFLNNPCNLFLISTASYLRSEVFLYLCSTFLSSKASHKDMGDSKSTLLRLYYQHRLFMGYCAIGAEVRPVLYYHVFHLEVASVS